MSITTPSPRRLGRARNPHNARRHRADFARQATIDAFGWRFARALDWDDFTDRKPWQIPARAPAARYK